MTITEKIRDEWGTVRHFCRKNQLSYTSLTTVIYGREKSQKCLDVLIACGIISSANDLPQYHNTKLQGAK